MSAAGWAAAGVAAYDVISGPTTADRRKDVRYGHEQDNRYGLAKEASLYARSQERGLTPQEYYGSAAPGASGPSGGAQVLGNMRSKRDVATKQNLSMLGNAAAERSTKLEIAKIQSQTQLKSAEISSGTQRYSTDVSATTQTRAQDLQNAIATKNWALAKKRLETIETPKLLQELKISRQQFKKLTNEIATSTPKFMLYMKKLSMGVDNMMVEFLQHAFGVDITDPKSVQRMSPSQRAAFLQQTAGINSHAFKEAAGIGMAAQKVGGDIFTGIGDIVAPSNSNPQNLGNVKNQRFMQIRENQRNAVLGQ